jgi:hypothetical protein
MDPQHCYKHLKGPKSINRRYLTEEKYRLILIKSELWMRIRIPMDFGRLNPDPHEFLSAESGFALGTNDPEKWKTANFTF